MHRTPKQRFTVRSIRWTKRDRAAKALLLGVVLLLGLFFIGGAYVTHGFIWSIYVPIYGHLLDSFPSPPDLLLESVHTTLEPYHPCGSKSYSVSDEHAEVVDFFASDSLHTDWKLVEHQRQSTKISPNRYFEMDKFIFVNRYQYWLDVNVETVVDAKGAQFDNPWVHLTVCRDAERYYILGGLPESE